MKLEATERERRLKIVEKGMKEDFWKVVSEHIAYVNLIQSQEVVELHNENRHEEARLLALKIKAKQEVLAEPVKILRENRPFLEKLKERMGLNDSKKDGHPA